MCIPISLPEATARWSAVDPFKKQSRNVIFYIGVCSLLQTVIDQTQIGHLRGLDQNPSVLRVELVNRQSLCGNQPHKYVISVIVRRSLHTSVRIVGFDHPNDVEGPANDGELEEGSALAIREELISAERRKVVEALHGGAAGAELEEGRSTLENGAEFPEGWGESPIEIEVGKRGKLLKTCNIVGPQAAFEGSAGAIAVQVLRKRGEIAGAQKVPRGK
jgi:hypothetical protein